MCCTVHLAEFLRHDLQRFVRDQPGNRQSHASDHLASVAYNETPLKPFHFLYRLYNVLIAASYDNYVVRVVGNGRGECASPQAEALDKSHADVAGSPMSLHDSQFKYVPSYIGHDKPIHRIDF